MDAGFLTGLAPATGAIHPDGPGEGTGGTGLTEVVAGQGPDDGPRVLAPGRFELPHPRGYRLLRPARLPFRHGARAELTSGRSILALAAELGEQAEDLQVEPDHGDHQA